MSDLAIPTMADVRRAELVIREHLTEIPLVRSYALEKLLQLPVGRRVWLKDYGWTPSGSFKLLGGLNWMANRLPEIGSRPVVAHSSGNFASGIAFAGMRYQRRVIVVMPETAPRVKFELTRSFGADIRTYDISRDHLTGDRDRITREIVVGEGGVQASPYDDPHVIAGNGVGGLEVVEELRGMNRGLSHFFCPVSGGGLMAGQALAIADGFPDAKIMGVEPAEADDFRRSLAADQRVRLDKPTSICDGLLSYDVGQYNWPILRRLVSTSLAILDADTRGAMRWIYQHHGLRVEPSGAIAVAAAIESKAELQAAADGDVVIVLSGRNVDESSFQTWVERPT